MPENNPERADHVLSLSIVPWKTLYDLVAYLRKVSETLDDGSNFGRVDGMSVAVAADILEGLGKPGRDALNAGADATYAKHWNWNSGRTSPQTLIETAHKAVLNAMVTIASKPRAEKLAWPAPKYDAWRQCHIIGDLAYSESKDDAEMIVERVNAYILAGEPFTPDEHKARPEVEFLGGIDAWGIADIAYAEKKENADLIAAAICWHALQGE